MYNCPGGVLLVPAPRCVGPECRGGPRGGGPTLGYAGDLDAGSRGSFLQAGRLIGITALDGVEIQRGLAAIDDLAASNQIDRYYAASAKRAYLERLGEEPERAAPFEEPTPFGRVLAPGALARRFRGLPGEDVGPSVEDACRCTPRPFDAIDPVSGWGIYYVKGGVLLTPSLKCIGGGGRPSGFWATTWRNVVSLVRAPEIPPSRPIVTQRPPPPPTEPPPPSAPPPPPPGGYLCLDYRVVPTYWRPQPTPCVPPQIPYPGQ